MHRRDLLKSALLMSAAGWPALSAEPTRSNAEAFDFAALKGRARALATAAYRAPAEELPAALAKLNWDQMQQIHFRGDHALWRDLACRYRLKFFALSPSNRTPVRMHEVVDGRVRPLEFGPQAFDFGKSGIDPATLGAELGVTGFQVLFHTDWEHDVAAFQGASYFRAVGSSGQYGLSARGLAVDCGLDRAEEFPPFTDFWFERPAPNADRLRVLALLDSPSISGAYEFVITPGEPLVMDIDAALYPRKPIVRLGIAPLTSMFLCGENDRRVSDDFRPEIHDSDGLAMSTGGDEWIWRPLTNPARLRYNAYTDENPRGFGLLERDRAFDHFQDDGAFYDRRPSLWVEPQTGPNGQGWGRGTVDLVEIPTSDETADNMVAFWRPHEVPKPGHELLYSYRLTWGEKLPANSPLATVRATRTGIGGVVGQKRKYFSWRFVVDFAGGELASLPPGAKVEPVISASRGEVEIPSARPLEAIHGWRAIFDLKPIDDRDEPINLRLFLRSDGRALTETWLYQWTAPPAAARKF